MSKHLLFVAFLIGCTPGVVVAGDEGGGGNGGDNGYGGSGGSGGSADDPNGGGVGGNKHLDVSGTYNVTTQFNLIDALPDEVKGPLQMTLSFADSPGKFLLDEGEKLPVLGEVFKIINNFSGVRNKIAEGIDDYINQWSGGMVSSMHDIATDLEMALRGMRAHNRLTISAADASGKVQISDTLVDLTFVYAGVEYPMPRNAKAMVGGQVTGLKLTIPTHGYDRGASLGSILVDLVDNVALPQLTGVNSLGALLNQLIDCPSVADWVWYNWDVGSWGVDGYYLADYIGPPDLAKLCTNALNAGGKAVEKLIAGLDGKGMMSMSDATCIMTENHGKTGHADTITHGEWTLALPVASTKLDVPGVFMGAGGTSAP